MVMEVLFVTWDKIGSQTGGGVVTYNELEFLKELGNVTVINPPLSSNPFIADDYALSEYLKSNKKYKLAHFYSSTYSRLIEQLKKDGTKITYTAAAHDIEKSKEEHVKNGISFNLPHLTDRNLFKKYVDDATMAYQTPEYLGKKAMQDDRIEGMIQAATERAKAAAHSPFLDMHKTYSKGVSDLETKIQKLEKEITDDQMMKPIYDKLNKGISIDNENPNAVNKIRSLQFLRNELMNRKATVNYLAEHLGLPSEVVNSNNESSTYTTPDGKPVIKLK
jgi:predicted transcriptional regulator